MNITIRKSKIATLKSFDNLFIEMSEKYCNQKCKHCYIDFPEFKKVQDFIEKEIIENALSELKDTDIKYIYLTGAEPMTHPDFNAILRLCLKKADVCICTNGSFINEKKARFLKKVENESKNEIFFRISLDHYDEIKNDEVRYRGAYRQAIFAIKHLIKYDFTPFIIVTNFYKEKNEVLKKEICKLFWEYNIKPSQILINNYFDKNSVINDETITTKEWNRLDCEYGRILTSKGIYACPFLSGDYRGRCGSNFKDFAHKIPIETNYCSTCINNTLEMFSVNFENMN